MTAREPLIPVLCGGGVVFDPASRILLVRRGRPPMRGTWTLPGGRLNDAETVVAGVEREVREETGIRVTAGPLVEVVEIVAEGRRYIVHDHLCEPLDPAEVPKAGDDAAEARYVARGELAEMEITDAVVRVVEKGFAMRAAAAVRRRESR